MATEYVMPKLAMAMNEGTINEWLIGHGEKVEQEAPLATVETEKVAYDVTSPTSGYLCIVKDAGETVECDTLIAWFCESPEEVEAYANQGANNDAPDTVTAATESSDNVSKSSPSAANNDSVREDAATAVSAPAPVSVGRIIASPLAKKMARDKDLNLALVQGSGPNGRIVKRDVNDALSRNLHLNTGIAAPTSGPRELARIPIAGMRKVISDRMMQSLQTTAQLSSAWESDITDLMATRAKFVERQDALGTKVSVNAFLIKAMAYAIKQVPIANACREGDDIVVFENINMGIAMSLPGNSEYESGLVVAVLRNVERMGLVEIDIEMKALFERVRGGKGTREDTTGSTITLSSTAGIAPPGMTTTPVLNLPNAALVGPSTPVKRPVVHNGDVVVRTMLPVSFTFDHCLLDGEPAARFMSAMHDALENPELMLA